MHPRIPSTVQVLALLGLACVFWYLIFGLKLVNFWAGMSVAACTLAGLGIWQAGWPVARRDLTLRHAGLGLVAALVLYGLFALGYAMAQQLFAFAQPEVSSIYAIRAEAHPWLIALVLMLVTSPAEELFWRGFVQRWAMARLGPLAGWLVAACVYGGIHVLSGNVMLTLAAFVAGLFWGALYAYSRSLTACIISHALWTSGIFIFWPMAA